MSQWPSIRARRALAALLRVGWTINGKLGLTAHFSAPVGPILYLLFTMTKSLVLGCSPESQSEPGFGQRTCRLPRTITV